MIKKTSIDSIETMDLLQLKSLMQTLVKGSMLNDDLVYSTGQILLKHTTPEGRDCINRLFKEMEANGEVANL